MYPDVEWLVSCLANFSVIYSSSFAFCRAWIFHIMSVSVTSPWWLSLWVPPGLWFCQCRWPSLRAVHGVCQCEWHLYKHGFIVGNVAVHAMGMYLRDRDWRTGIGWGETGIDCLPAPPPPLWPPVQADVQAGIASKAIAGHRSNGGLLMGQRPRRWPISKTALIVRLLRGIARQ